MTTLEYLQAQACTVAWTAGHSHGLNAMVGVLYALRNAAELNGEWGTAIASAARYFPNREISGEFPPDTRHPDFQSLLKIAPQIITDLADRLKYTHNRHFYLNFSETPPASGGALTIGNLFFF